MPPSFTHLTLPPLRKLCQHLGLPSSATKSVLLASLLTITAPQNIHSTTLSIDLGIRNLAYCQLAPDSSVTRWDRVALPLPGGGVVPKIELPIYAAAAISLRKSLPPTDEILIEHQRWRSGGARSVLPITIAVNTIEAMLHVVFLGKAVCVEPAAIAKTWGLEGGKDRKKEKVEMVRRLLKEGGVKGELGAWETNKKKDDLSDCLVQALTWKRWMVNRKRWVEGEWPVGLEELEEVVVKPKKVVKSRAKKAGGVVEPRKRTVKLKANAEGELVEPKRTRKSRMKVEDEVAPDGMPKAKRRSKKVSTVEHMPVPVDPSDVQVLDTDAADEVCAAPPRKARVRKQQKAAILVAESSSMETTTLDGVSIGSEEESLVLEIMPTKRRRTTKGKVEDMSAGESPVKKRARAKKNVEVSDTPTAVTGDTELDDIQTEESREIENLGISTTEEESSPKKRRGKPKKVATGDAEPGGVQTEESGKSENTDKPTTDGHLMVETSEKKKRVRSRKGKTEKTHSGELPTEEAEKTNECLATEDKDLLADSTPRKTRRSKKNAQVKAMNTETED